MPPFTQAMAMGVVSLFVFSWLIQTVEYGQIFATPGAGLWPAPPGGRPWWDWPLQRADIPSPRLRALADRLYSPSGMRWQIRLRGWGGLALPAILALNLCRTAAMPPGFALLSLALGFLLSLLLCGLHVLMLVRWRGAFNGGSDFMTLMVLLGLLIATGASLLGQPELGWRAGFAFISLQAVSSYFLSGSVKLLRPEWRSGVALTAFLNEAVRGPLPARHWARRPLLARLASWAFILWECAFALALWQPDWALLFCASACVFHFLVFWFFGLNRFFWAWLATFPAIIWCAAAHWH